MNDNIVEALRAVQSAYAEWLKLCCNVYEIVTPEQVQQAHARHFIQLMGLAEAVAKEVKR